MSKVFSLIENCNDTIRKVESMGHPNRKAIAAVYKRNLAALERERNELKNMIETEETKTESLLDGDYSCETTEENPLK